MENTICITRLPEIIEGKGSTRGHIFRKVYEKKLPDGKNAYIYSQEFMEGAESDYYEIIFPSVSKKVTEWQGAKPILSENEFEERYPGDECWGKIAWTCRGYDRAMKKLEEKN